MRKICICATLVSLLFCACQDEKVVAQKEVVKSESVSEPKKANFLTKVRSKIGEAFLLRGGVGDSWIDVKTGFKVVENDRLRTKLESEVLLNTRDGSILKVDEKSDVALKFSERKDGHKAFLVDVNEGTIHFDIQRQKDNSIEFRTGIAAAAIRGTAGFVGNVKGKMVASLKEGKVDVTGADGKTNLIVQNQTILVDEKGEAKTLNLASSGTKHLARVIDSISKGVEFEKVELVEKSLKTFDESFVERQKVFEKQLKFNTDPASAKIYVPSITLSARVSPGVIVSVWGEADTVGANGIYSRTFTWADDAYGTKRFLASCGDGSVEIPCYMWVTEYVSVDEPAVEAPVEESSASAAADNENQAAALNLSVKLGARTERVHLDLPATSLNTNLNINLAGISAGDLKNLNSIEVRRGGKVVKTFGANDLTSLAYEVPVEIARNKIADFEVVVSAKNGKKYRAKKTYEVYCFVANHSGGKARNSIVPPDQEYERLKQSGGLSRE